MADTNETTTDIIAEMRRRIAVKMSDAWYTQEEWRKLCDRLEAAWKREKAAIEADALAVGGIVEAARRRERDNSAALREALVRVLDWLKRMNAQPLNTLAVSELTPSYAVNRTAKSIIEDNDYHISQLTAALSAPPRNCDRFATADEAFHAWNNTVDTPGGGAYVGLMDWLYAPATEKEGGNDAD
jgi:hypothetical protein